MEQNNILSVFYLSDCVFFFLLQKLLNKFLDIL